jgi:glycosyltransferase involved in cell wall biosynthesis
MPLLEKAFVIIPVWGEVQTIGPVVEAAQRADPDVVATDRILVIDNNSPPQTALNATAAGALVEKCPIQGKGYAMDVGVGLVREFGGQAVVFLDGDLRGLQGDHVSRLAEPILEAKANMTIGYLGGRRRLAKKVLQYWGALSGQRGLRLVNDTSDEGLIDVWGGLRPCDLKGSRTEGALNALLRNRRLGHTIERLELEDLRHVGQREKQKSLLKAGRRYVRTYGSAAVGLMSKAGK